MAMIDRGYVLADAAGQILRAFVRRHDRYTGAKPPRSCAAAKNGRPRAVRP